jgi:hypothetical protein
MQGQRQSRRTGKCVNAVAVLVELVQVLNRLQQIKSRVAGEACKSSAPGSSFEQRAICPAPVLLFIRCYVTSAGNTTHAPFVTCVAMSSSSLTSSSKEPGAADATRDGGVVLMTGSLA